MGLGNQRDRGDMGVTGFLKHIVVVGMPTHEAELLLVLSPLINIGKFNQYCTRSESMKRFLCRESLYGYSAP